MFSDYGKDILRSIAFLSRLPVPARLFDGQDHSLSVMIRAFPAAGFIVALPAALVLFVLSAAHAPPLLAALIALAVNLLVTGALHEDGLADVADGFGGGQKKDRILDIMRDSRIGTYGGLALILTLAIRATALSSLIAVMSPVGVALVFLGVAAVSRTLMLCHWYALPAARIDGVAARSGLPDRTALLTALVAGTVIAICCFGPVMPVYSWTTAIVMALVLAGLFTIFSDRKIGGHTGDTIGASEQISEMALLATLAIVA
ncbi:adenosylcobinamide-GDP ribazoletransferase [Rhizobium sp. PAMB 3182]